MYLVFLGLAVALIGALFTALMWGSFQRALDQRSWPQVEAVVLSSEVEEYQHDEFSPKEYRLKILFGYEWKGEAMTGDRLTARGSSPSKDRRKIAGQERVFPTGAKVSAFVNPADPEFAILKPDSKAAGYSIWFPLLFVVGGLGIVVKAVLSSNEAGTPLIEFLDVGVEPGNVHLSPQVRGMKIVTYKDAEYPEFVKNLRRRAIPEDSVRDLVADIISKVAAKGDEALIEFTQQFDGAKLSEKQLFISEAEFAEARESVSDATREAVRRSLKNIHAFAEEEHAERLVWGKCGGSHRRRAFHAI